MRFEKIIAITAPAVVAALFVVGSARPQDDHPFDPNWPKIHDSDLGRWGQKTGLSKSTLKELLRAAGREGSYDYDIQNLDPRSLKKRGQVLLSTYEFGTGHCMTVYAIDTRMAYYEKVWEAAGAGVSNFCTESVLGAATASVGPQGTIVVKLPVWNGEVPKGPENSELLVVVYVWAGKTYQLGTQRKFSHYKWNGTDWEARP